MKQKIVVQVSVETEKGRSKALKIAAMQEGQVNSVALEGGNRDQVVVIGENVDPVRLVKDLRKKFWHVNIVSVEEAKKEKEKDDKKPTELPWWYYTPHPHPHPPSYAVYDECPNSICNIM